MNLLNGYMVRGKSKIEASIHFSCYFYFLPFFCINYLQTLQQPWLRLRLSDLIFNTHFESKIFSLSRDNISISRIVQEYFLFLPRPTSVNTNDEEEDEVIETGFSRGGREEMAYLLLVMLQSYLKCCSGVYTAWSL